MPDEDLPFSPQLPKTKIKPVRSRLRFPLVRAIVDSAAEWSFRPLVGYARKEWKWVKKYPGFLILAVLLAIVAAWYCTRWWYVEKPYTGETILKLYFEGAEIPPTEVKKSNIYRSATLQANMEATSPKNEKEINIAVIKFWEVHVLFDKEVDTENSLLHVQGLTQDVRLEVRDFNRRAALVTILADKQGAVPKGMLEISVKRRTSNSN